MMRTSGGGEPQTEELSEEVSQEDAPEPANAPVDGKKQKLKELLDAPDVEQGGESRDMSRL